MQAKEFLQNAKTEHTLILCGDAPFVDSDTIARSYESHLQNGESATVITAENVEEYMSSAPVFDFSDVYFCKAD